MLDVIPSEQAPAGGASVPPPGGACFEGVTVRVSRRREKWRKTAFAGNRQNLMTRDVLKNIEKRHLSEIDKMAKNDICPKSPKTDVGRRL